MKCVHGISLREPCKDCGVDWTPGNEPKPICNCQGRGLQTIFHLANCPVRVDAAGQVKP